MSTDVIEAYVEAFVAQCEVMWRPGCRLVNEPGVYGLLSTTDEPPTRLVVTDDRACGALDALLRDAGRGLISVFAGAARSTSIVASSAEWRPKPVTAMICRDLRSVPEVPLPSDLVLRPVRRREEDPPGGVPLDEAVALVAEDDPSRGGDLEGLAEFLRSLPEQMRLFAAVDAEGVVRATSGAGTFLGRAMVLFVNTHPASRRRGIGAAMTAAALRDARSAGARQAVLDASEVAVGVYERLGFETVSRTTQFNRAG